jgi:hypothetical protein
VGASAIVCALELYHSQDWHLLEDTAKFHLHYSVVGCELAQLLSCNPFSPNGALADMGR